ncbi:hypothetical protein P364_0107060 [Paenibacillus sp. MAEPY2]|nr:hypothetical protein P363_0133050 [Paenibacillus sp. MAEPY1]KGP83790.1 hypothetical protein P364_0107060 [Paenibacillus sp. MAEPY2]
MFAHVILSTPLQHFTYLQEILHRNNCFMFPRFDDSFGFFPQYRLEVIITGEAFLKDQNEQERRGKRFWTNKKYS